MKFNLSFKFLSSDMSFILADLPFRSLMNFDNVLDLTTLLNLNSSGGVIILTIRLTNYAKFIGRFTGIEFWFAKVCA